jgi:hypothetical protein
MVRVAPAVVMAAAVVFIIVRVQSGKPFGPLPNWTASSTEASSLAGAHAVRGFTVRPPAGYKTYLANRYQLWLDPPHTPGAYFDVTVAKADGTELTHNAKEIMQRVDNPKKYSGRSDSKSEWGDINGVTFVRSDWSGVDRHGIRFLGFQYSTVTSHGFVLSLYGRASDPGAAAILKSMDTSARTVSPAN